MINIVLPMAGAGSRFQNAGYSLPKPFIDIDGKMMIERVLDGVRFPNAHYTLIIREDFEREYADLLQKISREYFVAFESVEKVTQGASCTALAALEIINNSTPVVFVDSDNIFANGSFSDFLENAIVSKIEGSLLTVNSNKNCFSYAKVQNGFVTETREKEVISSHAITGAYYFGHGSDFCRCAIEMMMYGDRQKNEYYMSNVYNRAIKKGLRVSVFDIPLEKWHCVGTPDQLEEFLTNKNLFRK